MTSQTTLFAKVVMRSIPPEGVKTEKKRSICTLNKKGIKDLLPLVPLG